MKAMLIDSTRCVGCRGCQVACKSWNELPSESTTFFAGEGYQNPRDLSASTWTLITYSETKRRGRFDWVFGKRQCMHCLQPACATACPVHALQKTDEGPVVYDASVCLGCRYCQLACPFNVPRFEWDKVLTKITKCTLCADRVAEGREPACAKACPTDAIEFGERDALLAAAHQRIRENPRSYLHHVYGEHEVGGTCVFHITDVPAEQLGHAKDLSNEPYSAYSKPAMAAIPYVLTGLGIGLGAVSWVINRRQQLAAQQKGETE